MPINKVRVKDKTTGKWKSKTVPTLILARQFETKFKTEDIIKEQAPSLVPLKDSPREATYFRDDTTGWAGCDSNVPQCPAGHH